MTKDQELMQMVAEACLDENAQRLTILEVGDLTVLADYFVLASGRSTVHVKSIVEHVEEILGEKGIHPRHRDGTGQGTWCVLDYSSVILHVFRQAEREYYNLEELWRGAREVILPGLKSEIPSL